VVRCGGSACVCVCVRVFKCSQSSDRVSDQEKFDKIVVVSRAARSFGAHLSHAASAQPPSALPQGGLGQWCTSLHDPGCAGQMSLMRKAKCRGSGLPSPKPPRSGGEVASTTVWASCVVCRRTELAPPCATIRHDNANPWRVQRRGARRKARRSKTRRAVRVATRCSNAASRTEASPTTAARPCQPRGNTMLLRTPQPRRLPAARPPCALFAVLTAKHAQLRAAVPARTARRSRVRGTRCPQARHGASITARRAPGVPWACTLPTCCPRRRQVSFYTAPTLLARLGS